MTKGSALFPNGKCRTPKNIPDRPMLWGEFRAWTASARWACSITLLVQFGRPFPFARGRLDISHRHARASWTKGCCNHDDGLAGHAIGPGYGCPIRTGCRRVASWWYDLGHGATALGGPPAFFRNLAHTRWMRGWRPIGKLCGGIVLPGSLSLYLNAGFQVLETATGQAMCGGRWVTQKTRRSS